MMKNLCEVVNGLKPTILMVVVQLIYVWINTLYKLVVYDGMSLRVLIVYRFVFAFAFLAPLAFVVERKKRPKMTWTILFQGLICGLFGGTLAQILLLEMLALTTVTFVSAMSNLVPAATFVIALFFGLEKLNWKAASGKAKIIGTLVGTGGAMILTFFKLGARIPTPSFHVSIYHPHNSHVAYSHFTSNGSTLLGALCALGFVSSFSLWLIVQSKMSERYPCYSSATLMNLVASVFSIGLALCTERDWNQWKLGWNIRLLTAASAGLGPAGLNVVMIAWCVSKRGPLFVSAFGPLQLLFMAFVGFFFMDEMLHLGSIIGAVLIVCGLYMVLWGKGKEMKNMNILGVPSQSLHKSSPPSVEIIVKSSIDDDKKPYDSTSSVVDKDHQKSSENENQATQEGKYGILGVPRI